MLCKNSYLIRSITKNGDDYDEKYIRIKFNLDEKLPLNKLIEIPNIIIVFHKNQKYYPQLFLMNGYKNYE